MADVCENLTIDGGVLVGHDGSPCAQQALIWAAALADRTGLPLHVVRAWSMVTAPRPETWQPGYVPPLSDYEKAVQNDLDACLAAADLDPSVPTDAHAVHAPPAKALIEAATGADLLVVGARGVGGFAGLLLGSVSEQCVHHAPCPVTVIRRDVGRAFTERAAPETRER